MALNKKPIPTEYRGIRFNSKSEAVFAYFLDATFPGGWFFEPEWATYPDGVRCDFVAVVPISGRLGLLAIEYKPAAIAPTYLNETIGPRFEALARSLDHPVFSLGLLAVFGNPYSVEESGAWIFRQQREVGKPSFCFDRAESGLWNCWADSPVAQAAKAFRFDLL